jgi:hypothetical protein
MMMNRTNQEDMRLKQRSNVDLKTIIILTGDKKEHQCRITNLSATGAQLECEATSSLTKGMSVAIQISIPSTIMHIPNTAEIMWVEKDLKKYRVGIKFTDFLSETMKEQLTKS